jgi:hypothetical protein
VVWNEYAWEGPPNTNPWFKMDLSKPGLNGSWDKHVEVEVSVTSSVRGREAAGQGLRTEKAVTTLLCSGTPSDHDVMWNGYAWEGPSNTYPWFKVDLSKPELKHTSGIGGECHSPLPPALLPFLAAPTGANPPQQHWQ